MIFIFLNANRLYWVFSNGIAKVNNRYESSQQKVNFIVFLLIHSRHAMFIDWLNQS